MAHRRLCISPRQDVPPADCLRVVGALVSLLLVTPPGALPADGHAPLVETPAFQTFQDGQAIDVRTGRPISFENWITDLAARDVIYLGEEHRNRSHVEAALKILQALLVRGRQPVLGLEMFGWDGQAGLD
ncbi:MAG: ChaN family lipoprotein, partial [Nitrospiraceae bacterium]